jgi:glycyl-tRNA synthetase beta subunit
MKNMKVKDKNSVDESEKTGNKASVNKKDRKKLNPNTHGLIRKSAVELASVASDIKKGDIKSIAKQKKAKGEKTDEKENSSVSGDNVNIEKRRK